MKKRWLLYVIFGLVFYLLFLIVKMPASWFAWGLNYYTHGTVRLDPISGSLWRGTGRLVYYYPPNVPHEMSNTEWHINPLWLLAGRVQMNWRSNTQNTRLNTHISLSSGKVELTGMEASFPAQSLSLFYPAAALISPEGQVKLSIGKLTLDGKGMTGGGDIQWLEAGSSLTPVQPLGDYRLEISGTGETANIKLSTLRGALELTGQGQWQMLNGQLQFAGSAIPRERASELEPILKFLGEDQGGGRRPLTLNVQLPLRGLAGV